MFRACCECQRLLGCMGYIENKKIKRIVSYNCPVAGSPKTCDLKCPPDDAKVSHGLCEYCHSKAMERIEEKRIKNEMQRM